MKQCAITIIAELDRGRNVAAFRADLEALEQRHGRALQDVLFGEACARCREQGPHVRCTRCKRHIHFLSFFVYPDAGPLVDRPEAQPAFVVLEVNADGSSRSALQLLAERVPGFLEQLFRDCRGAPTSAPAPTRAWFRFLRQHDVGADAFYIANPGRSVEQVALERSLREQATAQLPAAAERALDCTSVWQGLRDSMRDDLAQAKPAPRLPFRMRWGTHAKGLFQQLRGYRRLLGALSPRALMLAAIVCVLYKAYTVISTWWPVVLLVPLSIAGAWMLPLWLRERPVHARDAAWRTFIWAWLKNSATLTAGAGFVLWVVQLWQVPFASYQLWLAYAAAGAAIGLGFVTVTVVAVFAGVAAGKLIGYATALLAGAAWSYFALVHCSAPQQLWAAWSIASGSSVLIIGGFLLWFLARIRDAEAHDQEPAIATDLQRLDVNTRREDCALQNHLATVTELRPEPIRRYALQLVLRAVSLLATIHFNQGDLNGITSIHFARFVVYSHAGKQWLLFMGNYDGGFNAYLGAFSPVLGTSAVWGNTKEFPRSLGLIWDGARDEQRFKAFGRKSQVQTLGWFSAHPTLSTSDVAAGTATRMALQRTPQGRDARVWPRLARAVLGPRGALEAELAGAFDEAACDAALRRL